jgi:hypothetical protein
MKTEKSIKVAKTLATPIILFLAFLVIGACMLEFGAIPIEGPGPHPPGGVGNPPEAWGNFQPVPIMLKDIGVYDAKPGDIVSSSYGLAYVAIDSQRALYLDFNVMPVGQIEVNVEEPLPDSYVSNPYVGAPIEYPPKAYYHVVGQVDENIMDIIKAPGDSGKALVDKQFRIWAYLGVDEEAMRIVWKQAYARTDVEWAFTLPALQMYAEMGKQIQTNILEANPDVWHINFTPHGYSSMAIDAWNLGNHDAALNVQLGTKFDNAGGTNQNLGAGEPVMVYVPAGTSKMFELKTYCLNAHKGVPTMNDALNPVGVVPDNVKETMEQAFAAGTTSTGESQSAVWQQTG